MIALDCNKNTSLGGHHLYIGDSTYPQQKYADIGENCNIVRVTKCGGIGDPPPTLLETDNKSIIKTKT